MVPAEVFQHARDHWLAGYRLDEIVFTNSRTKFVFHAVFADLDKKANVAPIQTLREARE